MKHVQVLFLSLFTYADAAVDMLSGRNTYVTLDRVMGGQSSATGTATADGSSIVFEGSVSTQGGGFAYMTFSGGSSMDLTANSGSGILLTFETMKQSTYGSAPLGFNIELEESGRRCTLSAAFAVPMTSEVERVQAWVPFTQFEPKGSHWQYSQSSTGVPSTCGSSTASTAGVTRFAIGNYYQEGPFRLVLYSVETRTAPPASLLAPSPSASPNDLLTGAAYRARTLMAKVGAGVGEAQMAGMAAAVLATAAAQAGDAALVAIVDGIASSTAAVRAATLAEAFKVSQSGGTPSLDALMSVGTASASTTSVDGTSSASTATSPSPPSWPLAATSAVVLGIVALLLLLLAVSMRAFRSGQPLTARSGMHRGGRLAPEESAGASRRASEGKQVELSSIGSGGAGRDDLAAVEATPASMTVMETRAV